MTITTWDTPNHYCPSCEAQLNATTGPGTMERDSLTVCVYCCATLTFDPQASGGLRGLTLTEWTELRQDDPEAYREVMEIVQHYTDFPARWAQVPPPPPSMGGV